MPRMKGKAIKRIVDNVESIESPVSKRKKRFCGTLRRIHKVAPPDGIVLGSDPISLSWNVPDNHEPPHHISWTDTCEAVCGNTSVSLQSDDNYGILSILEERHGKSFELVYHSSTNSQLKLDIVVMNLPWNDCLSFISYLYLQNYSKYGASQSESRSSWINFFQELAQLQKSRLSLKKETYQHDDLLPTLRSYQHAAVQWMVDRESTSSSFLDLGWLTDVADILSSRDGTKLLYCKYGHSLRQYFQEVSISSGGILADEMGLGKTVITIALILNNRRVIAKEEDNPDNMEGSSSSDSESSTEELSSDDSDAPLQSRLSIKQLNKETCLNADEKLQLVPSNPRRGILRQNLNAWYEHKLAEMRVLPQHRSRPKEFPFKCTCGTTVSKMPRNAVKCGQCHLSQHKPCVGYNRGYTYKCPSCWSLQSPLVSGATLIVAPASIFGQWASEIARHAPSLRVFQYDRGQKFVQPSYMASFDVVLTTYNMLHAEILHTTKSPERRLRNEGRYLRLSCTLTCINWWRIICDEAQMVEGDVSSKRRMVQMLPACHRWSVTGTPIQRSIGDLFYLTEFMGLGPLDDKSVWADLLLTPYLSGEKKPLLSVLGQIFWRTSKEEVSDELGLPEQTFCRHLLKFSAIEESFYMQEHLSSANNFGETVRKSKVSLDSTLDSLDKSTLKRILQPMLNLRQACTHPQVVSGITITSATGTANLSELQTFLCRRTKQHCEEALRRHISSLNGLAGLHCLLFQWKNAVEFYRTVMRISKEYEGRIHVDTMQRIHAMTNAADLISKYPRDIPPTLRDDTLEREAVELENKYRSKAEDSFNTSFTQFKQFNKDVKNMVGSFLISKETWWVPVMYSLFRYENELLDKLSEELSSNDQGEKNLLRMYMARVSTMRGVEVTLNNWWTDLQKCHKKATDALPILVEIPRGLLVEQAVFCHLRSKRDTAKPCELCQVEKQMQDLECQLFFTSKKDWKAKFEKVMDGAVTKGSWKASYEERTMNILYNFAKSKVEMDPMCVKDGKLHGKLLVTMKKEFKQLRAAWTQMNHIIQAEDEIAMSKLRLRLPESSDEVVTKVSALSLTRPNKTETIHIITEGQIEPMLHELAIERDFSYSDFKKKLGQFIYLSHLEQKQNALPEPCPVCKVALEKQWCVLQCGHCYCLSCVQTIGVKRIKCPICREYTEGSQLSFVDTSRVDNTDINVAGNFSTKVDGIVRVALQIIRDDPVAKILIFSSWPAVLKILTHALELNFVRCRHVQQHNFRRVLNEFQRAESDCSVLLLPLNMGSKGLNLTEATHVFITEPILNCSEELQAIGRVHRIGQTKPTFVHRFLIKGTIEEKISAAVSEAKDAWANNTVTVDDLLKLFTIPVREEVVK